MYQAFPDSVTSSRSRPSPEHKLSCALLEHALTRGFRKPVPPSSTQNVSLLLLERGSRVLKRPTDPERGS